MTQLEQITNVLNAVYLLAGELGATAGKVKSLERNHYSAGELDALHKAPLAAVTKFRGGALASRKNADEVITSRFDEYMIKASAATVEQSQLAQIDSLRADAKAVIETLKQLVLDIEQLKANHPKQYDDALYWAATDALKEYRRINAPLRAIRKDAALTNGITAADGRAGIGEIIARYDSATTNKPQAKTGADHES